jgi:hypothetical protein
MAKTNKTNLLLKAYYEALYELLISKKDILESKIEEVLTGEIAKSYEDFDEEKLAAYRQACLAFIDERIEMYNPFGIQYLYDRGRAKEAFELELQLNWYDSRAEFEALVEMARSKAESLLGQDNLEQMAEELVAEAGAFPDKSIISAYHARPALNKLPDYVVASVIEDTI